MTKLFAAVNGEVIENLEKNTTPTYTRIHFLLNELKNFEDMEVMSIRFHLLPKKGPVSILYNNVLKSVVALRSALLLILYRPLVYFAYPHSLTTIQNRALFRLCKMIDLKIILDIHDTIEQAKVIGIRKSVLSMDLEGYCFANATLVLALNRPMWNYLRDKYQMPQDKRVVFVPNAYEESFCELYPEPYKSIQNRFNVCYLGGLTKSRGIEILVKASQELHKKYPYLKLYLFGSCGEGLDLELKDVIRESSFINRRQIPRKDLPGALNDVDLFVMPYDPRESYMNFSSPTKLFEYIGTGKPIICTKCESLLEIGKDGGIIYVDYDAADLEREAEMLILNPEIREKLSRELIKIRPHHTWRERAKRVYEALVSIEKISLKESR